MRILESDGTPMGRQYDDGFGVLWIYCESLGPVGVIRARTWADAYEIAEDAIMDDAGPDVLAERDTYANGRAPSDAGTDYHDEDAERPDAEDGELAEGFTYRPNGAPTCNGLSSHVACEDLNGSALVPVHSRRGREIWRRHGWKLEMHPAEGDAPFTREDFRDARRSY